MSSLSLVILVLSISLVTARQEWEEEPGYREVNPEGDVVMVCRVRNKAGECRWERDNTPIAAYAGKYEWAGECVRLRPAASGRETLSSHIRQISSSEVSTLTFTVVRSHGVL